MQRMVIALALVLAAVATAQAQEWKKELARPLVKVVGNAMRYEATELCTAEPAEDGGEPVRLQVRIRSEAPATGLISRDYFVAMSVLLSEQLLEDLGGADCKTIPAVIGSPDIDMSLVMTANGLQVEVKDTRSGQVQRETMLWAELFADAPGASGAR